MSICTTGSIPTPPPWNVLEVIGASPTPEVESALRAYGVERIEKTTTGFVAFRGVRGAV
jgi:hypothetical protein